MTTITDFHPLSLDALNAGLNHIRQSPADHGPLALIVRRPALGERETLDVGELNVQTGLVGDTWPARKSSRMPDGSPHPDMQITLMNARVIALIAQSPERWALAGDQLYVDLDLSTDNVPPGTRLAVGTAVVEITAQLHTGCQKFSSRFGADAFKWVNTPEGRRMGLRGVNAKVIQPGTIRVGDVAHKVLA